MGDRAYAQVVCSAKNVAVFEELGFGEEEYWKSLPEGVAFLVDQEANYGNSFPLSELAERGYVFIAQHDAGGEYDAARLVSDGKTFSEVDAIVQRTATVRHSKRQWVRRQEATAGGEEVLARPRTSEAEAGLSGRGDIGPGCR